VSEYQRLMRKHCNWRGRNCEHSRRDVCRALQRLVGKLRRSQDTAAARDDVRDSMKQLDRCRVRSGERLSLYGLAQR
jgi:hypothetical protein